MQTLPTQAPVLRYSLSVGSEAELNPVRDLARQHVA